MPKTVNDGLKRMLSIFMSFKDGLLLTGENSAGETVNCMVELTVGKGHDGYFNGDLMKKQVELVYDVLRTKYKARVSSSSSTTRRVTARSTARTPPR